MIIRPDGMNAFEFAVLSGLRAAQLCRGCAARVAPSSKVAVTAQHEVAQRKVLAAESVATHGTRAVVRMSAGKPADGPA